MKKNLELLEKLGDGGFADIWRAYDVVLEREVAVKIVREASLGISDALAHARALARVNHINVVSVFEITKIRDPDADVEVDCVVMELLQGITLAERLKSEMLSLAEAQNIGIGIINGLSQIHQQGMEHGDLHEENVMIVGDTPKVIDILYRDSLALLSTQKREAKLKRDIRSLRNLLQQVIGKTELGMAGETAFNMQEPDPSIDDMRVAFTQTLAQTSNPQSQESAPQRHRCTLWFSSLFQADHVSVAAFTNMALHNSDFEVEIEWPAELLKLAEHVRQILNEVQSRNRPEKLNQYAPEVLAGIVINANVGLKEYEKIINNAAKRVVLLAQGALPYYRFLPENLIENYLALCVFDAGDQLFRHAGFEPYRDNSLLAPWNSMYANDKRGKDLKVLLGCQEEVYAAHLSEISGYQLDGYEYFYGPESLIKKAGMYQDTSIFNPWFHQWIIPQLELLLTRRESSNVISYDEKVHICKIRDADFQQI